MSKSKEEILDLLRRAFEMEETMADSLVTLCRESEEVQGVPLDISRLIMEYLGIMHKDTLRHKQIVGNILDNNE